jgi:hypothetical protein
LGGLGGAMLSGGPGEFLVPFSLSRLKDGGIFVFLFKWFKLLPPAGPNAALVAGFV